jgi:hypothetical protein
MQNVVLFFAYSLIVAVMYCFIGLSAALIALAAAIALRCLFAAKHVALKTLPLGFLLACKLFSYLYFSIDYAAMDDARAKQDILARRHYLLQRTAAETFGEHDLPIALGSVFQKEWAIGTLSMTAAALTNIAILYPETADESRKAVAGLIERMLKQDIRDFEVYHWSVDPLEALDADKGQIGYLGHLNFMLGAYRVLGGDSRFESLHHQISAALARRMDNSKCPYLETFPAAIFVPDNMVVVASLQLYNKTYGDKHLGVVNKWIEFSKTKLIQAETGLLYPYVSQCEGVGVVRGSFSGWNSFYLPFIDKQLADQQYTALRRTFLDDPLGIVGIREYPKGIRGSGDIDSGPLVLGLSTSGTGFAVSGALHSGDNQNYNNLLQTAELAGTTIGTSNKRWYAFSPLVGEAIMLAMKTACTWDSQALSNNR